MLNIVIPMAGRGGRFLDQGYDRPKPLIPVRGKPMIQLVTENLKPRIKHRFVYIVLQEHIREFQVDRFLKSLEPTSEIVVINEVTEGAACTVLLAKKYIDNESPLMIANSDQYIDEDIDRYLESMEAEPCDGYIMTMTSNLSKWSYVRLDEENNITEVVEKEAVSDEATVGIYNFRTGNSFVRAANKMIDQNLRVNGEFYVAPVYNQLIEEGGVVLYNNIGSVGHGMHGLGTPEDLELFIGRFGSESAPQS